MENNRSKRQANKKQNGSKIEANENDNVNVNDNANANVNDNAMGDSCVDGLSKIIDFYNKNIGLITPYGLEVFEDYSKEMSDDLIILAMQKAVEADKKTIQYIKGILNNWSKKGIKTVLEAEKENKQFKTKTGKKTGNFEQRDYSNYDFNKLYANKGE